MCGICGKIIFDRGAKVSPALLKGMADAIVHRGPDDEGFHIEGPLGLGFRRLSIIDLGGGHQPLSNEDGTVWIVFNGEIYNYKELQEFLKSKGHTLRTNSDTEVIVHLYEEFGENCVEKLRGMFAFAIWDRTRQTLFLARDRVGIKPLYYWLSDRSLVFGSEIKAILADPEVNVEVAPEIIDRFLTFYYVPGEETLFRNIRKLAPGTCMLVKDGKSRIRQYWDLRYARTNQSVEEAEKTLNELLEECVQMHMISDVPVGFLLSGGVDSTAMLSFAAGKSSQAFSSYTLGFSSSSVTDERPYARLAAQIYGTEHHEATISAREFEDFLPEYIWHMEEPVCEPPAIALYYISKVAKDFVKVLISGEGGDEAFGGYPNYRNVLWLERLKKNLGPLKGTFGQGLLLLNKILQSGRITKYAPLMNIPFASYYYSRTSGPLQAFNDTLQQPYAKNFSQSVDKQYSTSVVKKYLDNAAAMGCDHDLVNQMLYVDTKTWLPDDLLLKADKMTMANSIELRVPLLDHKLLEFAASLPGNYKVRRFTTKYIAKKALQDRVPPEIRKRKKTGFPVPYENWLRHDLKDWLYDILLDSKTISRGYFDRRFIESLLEEAQSSAKFSKEIFSLAVLELWHREFLGTRRRTDAEPFLHSFSHKSE
jgi:asparagine synthase (glutamine-hydrolysing)